MMIGVIVMFAIRILRGSRKASMIALLSGCIGMLLGFLVTFMSIYLGETPIITEKLKLVSKLPGSNVRLLEPVCMKTVRTMYYYGTARSFTEDTVVNPEQCEARGNNK